jgi:hypothetical protein
MKDRRCLHLADDPILLDGDVPKDGETDASPHRVHFRHEPVGRNGTPPFSSLRIRWECRGGGREDPY